MKRFLAFLTAICLSTACSGITAIAAENEEIQNNTAATAQSISIAEDIVSSLENKNDSDWYKFSLTSAGILQMNFLHETLNSSSTYWIISVFENDGTTQLYSFTSVGNNALTSSCELGLDAGDYFIKVSASSYSANEYKLSTAFSESAVFETENNNSIEKADVFALNTEYKGAIINKDDVDWYKLTAETDGYVDISFSHDTIESANAFWCVYLYEADGTTLINSFESTGKTASYSTCDIGISAGDFYIKVTKGYSLSSDTYTLSASFKESDAFETESNNTMETADEIAFNKKYTGSIMTKDDADWYKFTVDKKGFVDINISHDTNTQSSDCWKFTLYKSDGTTVVNAINSNGNQGETAFPSISLEEGDYYLKAVRGFYWYNDNYTFSIDFTEDEFWETEINNTKENANPIKQNQKYTGTIMNGNDLDWYELDLENDEVISIEFEHDTIDSSSIFWVAEIYKSDGSTVLYSLNSEGNRAIAKSASISLEKGKYYVKIKPYGSSTYKTIHYTFAVNSSENSNWEKESNDTNTTANEIETNTAYFSSIMSSKDVDWFKFTTEEDGYVSINFEHETTESTANYWNIKILEADATTQVYALSVSGNSAVTVSPTIGLKAGEYYVKIAPQSTSSWLKMDTSMTVNYKATNYWEKEGNDNKNTATKINLDEKFGGSTMIKDDADWYTIDINKEGVYKLTFENPEADSKSTKYWTINMYNSDGAASIASTNVTGTTISTTLEALLTPGTHYVKITHGGYYYLTSDYYITLSEKNLKGDVNKDGEVDSADALTILQMVVGIIEQDAEAADIDGDGEITSGDALTLLQYVVGIIEQL